MVKLLILFKTASRSSNFDLRYRANRALLKKLPGLQRLQEGEIVGSPAGDAPYHRLVEAFFEDFDALDKALTSPQGVTAGKDLMEFAAHNVELLFVEVPDSAQSQRPLGPTNLQAYLDAHNIPAEIVYPGAPTPTVPAAAEALGVEPDQIVKSVVFLVEEKPFLVYGCGTRRVDSRKLAERLNVNRKKVKLADAAQVLDLTGFAVGTVPPLGLKTHMPAFMDPAVQAYDVVYAGGGGINALLKITQENLLKFSHAEVVPMLEDDSAPADPAGPTGDA